MLAKLKTFFEQDSAEQNIKPEDRLQEACAVLLIEVSRADFDESASEQSKIRELLSHYFGLSSEKISELINLSSEIDATSVHPFTSLINEHYEYEQRVTLIDKLWSVAYVDGELSKYEEALIRKIADLLYVRHSDFIKSKLAAQG